MDERSGVTGWDKALSGADPNGEGKTNTIVTVPVAATGTGAAQTGTAVDEPVDPIKIRAQIEETRAGMSETINAISERLNPETLKEQAQEQVEAFADQAKERVEDIADQAKEKLKETVQETVQTAKDAVYDATIGKAKDVMQNMSDTVSDAAQQVSTTMRDTGSSVLDNIRRNPLPAALIGLGLGMFLMDRRKRRASSYDSHNEYDGGADWSYEGIRQARQGQSTSTRSRAQNVAGDFIGNAQETVSNAAARTRNSVTNVAGEVRDQVGNIANQAVEQVSNLGSQLQHGARHAQSQYQQSLQENPLAVGAVSLALGAAVGMMLPSTRTENRWMGDARENLTQKAEEAARDTIEKVQEVAGVAKRAARKEAEYQGLTSGGADR